jgi:hypothetical protein
LLPPDSTLCRPPTAISDAGADGPAYGVGAAVSAAEGLGFWVNSLKSNGPGLSPPRLINFFRIILNRVASNALSANFTLFIFAHPVSLCLVGLTRSTRLPRGRSLARFALSILFMPSTAEAGGMVKGDLIVSVDGQTPSSLGGLRKMLLGPKGTKVEIGVERGGITMSVVVERGGGSMSQAPLLGIGMSFKHSPHGGYLVTNVKPGGPAERAGVRSDDVICLYNGENLTVNSNVNLNVALANNTEPIVRFGVRRGNAPTLLSVVVVRTPLSVGDLRDQSGPSSVSSPGALSNFIASPAAERERDARSAGASPALGGGAATYSSNVKNIREFIGSVGFNSSYDSELSDNYTSGSSRYTSQRGSFLSDGSREEYSSDECRSQQPSPQTYVGRAVLAPGPMSGSDSREHSQSPRLAPSVRGRDGGALHGLPRKEAVQTTRTARSPEKHHGDARGTSRVADIRKSQSPKVQRLDGPVSTEALRELKEEMEALNMRVERRLIEMESQIHARALINTKGNAEEAENFNPHAGRYESDMKLALQSEVKRQEAEQERINEEMARLQTMEKYRQEYENQRESERKRVAAELRRQEVEKERTCQENELRALLQAASQAEKDRRRVEEELADRISSFDRDLNRIAQEHDGMLEGFDEMKRLVKNSIERMEEHLKTNEHEMYLELNKVRSQVFEAISRKEENRAVVISTNSSTTVIEGKDGLISIHSPRTSSDDEYGTGKRRNPVSPRKSRDADQRKNETMPLDGHRSPPSTLVPRLRLRRCMIDDAVPSSLRCATVVVGRRLFLFPQGQDGMCDLQYAMVMDLASLRLWALRVMGSMPLRCRCNFFAVHESVCVFPCDANGSTDLKEAFILSSAEEDRVYSQGCLIEMDVPSSRFIDCQVHFRV